MSLGPQRSKRAPQDSAADGELMVRFANWDDIKAFEELVRRWEKPVLSYLAKASGDWESARDLRQEVFFRTYRYGKTYKPEYRFTTWLFRIASNVLSSWHTKQARANNVERSSQAQTEALEVAEFGAGPREHAVSAELLFEVRGALGRLLPAEREMMVLRLDLELSYREIGQILDMPETTVKSRVYNLLGGLRRTLERSGFPGRVSHS